MDYLHTNRGGICVARAARLVPVQRGLHQLGHLRKHLRLAGGGAEHAVEAERLLAALCRQPHAGAVRAQRDRAARVRPQAAEDADLRGRQHSQAMTHVMCDMKRHTAANI